MKDGLHRKVRKGRELVVKQSNQITKAESTEEVLTVTLV